MLDRLASLRVRLLSAMLGTAVVGLAAAYVVFGRIEQAHERAADRGKARAVAEAIASQAATGAGAERFRALQAVLHNDQIVVFRAGRRIFSGRSSSLGELELTASRPFPDGRVIVRDYASTDQSSSLELVLVAAVVIMFVIAAAVAATTLLTRALRRPIEHAIAAADRVASGDLSARMGRAGPDEFVRLGAAFDDMATRLETADQEQRRFLADLSHEIATPLHAVAGFAGAFCDGSAVTNEDRDEAASLIVEECERLRRLIAHLQELTHLDLIEPARLEPVDAARICQELQRRFDPAARAAGVTLRARARPLALRSDTRLLDTVLVNLITNAIRYTPAGGSVELDAQDIGHEVIFSVRDTGSGINSHHQTRVFDRLYRVDAARDRATGGSGLGLAITQRAAHALGGRIELTSAPGAGSEFRLILPRMPTTPSPHAPQDSLNTVPAEASPPAVAVPKTGQ